MNKKKNELKRQEKSLRHVAMVAKFLDLNKLWSSTNMAEKSENIDLYDFPVHMIEQNGSAYFSSIVRQCKWLSPRAGNSGKLLFL